VKDALPDRRDVPDTVDVRVERREAVSELLPVEDPVGEEDPVDVRVD
jgi:hypothetical protein